MTKYDASTFVFGSNLISWKCHRCIIKKANLGRFQTLSLWAHCNSSCLPKEIMHFSSKIFCPTNTSFRHVGLNGNGTKMKPFRIEQCQKDNVGIWWFYNNYIFRPTINTLSSMCRWIIYDKNTIFHTKSLDRKCSIENNVAKCEGPPNGPFFVEQCSVTMFSK